MSKRNKWKEIAHKTHEVTCDYCGRNFPDNQKDEQAADEDHCVCPNCSSEHRRYMRSMGS